MKILIRVFIPALFALLVTDLQVNAQSLSLGQSVGIALEQNLGIKQADENLSIAKARTVESRAAFLPGMSMSYGYTRLDSEPTMFFPGIGPLIPPTTIKVGTMDNYAWALEARQPLFAGGAIYNSYKASKTGIDMASLEKQAQINDVIEQTKTAYCNVIKAARMRDAAKSYVEMLKAHMNTAQAFYDVKIVPLNDLLRAEVELASGQRALLSSENNLKMAEAQFNIFLRRDINEAVMLEDNLRPVIYNESLEKCIEQAIQSRPEVISARYQKQQSESMLKVAKSEYFPSLNALGHFERAGSDWDVNGSQYKDNDSWYVSAVATWNFWEWGRTKSRVDTGRSRLNQSESAILQIEDRVRLETKKAWLDLNDSLKQVEVAEKAIARAEENYRVSAERYRERLGTGTEVLDAEALLTRTRSDYAAALGDNAIALARLERAMGVMLPPSSVATGGVK